MSATETERPIGFGRLKRKEDARFIRWQGTYLDDIRLAVDRLRRDYRRRIGRKHILSFATTVTVRTATMRNFVSHRQSETRRICRRIVAPRHRPR